MIFKNNICFNFKISIDFNSLWLRNNQIGMPFKEKPNNNVFYDSFIVNCILKFNNLDWELVFKQYKISKINKS